MKAIIPVAGLGTRMLPATKATAKEMLTVVDQPLIEHVVHEAVDAGIKDIVLVTQSNKASIEKHFETDRFLEDHLLSHGKLDLIQQVQAICPEHVNIITVRQDQALGLGHAILCAKPVIGDDDFIVMLPDVLVKDCEYPNNLSYMLLNFLTSGASQIMVQPVDPDQVHKYGVADIDGQMIAAGQSVETLRFVEKPGITEAPSNLAIVGRYILSKKIWPLLEGLKPGAGDEIQLTDAIDELLNLERVDAYHLDGESYDCGSKLGLLQANMAYAMSNHHLKVQMIEFMEDLIRKNKSYITVHNKNQSPVKLFSVN